MKIYKQEKIDGLEGSLENDSTIAYCTLAEKCEPPANQDISKDDLFTAIKILNDFLEKSILRPSNIHFPNERLIFLNYLN